MTNQPTPEATTTKPAAESDDTTTALDNDAASVPPRSMAHVRVFHNNQPGEAMLTGYQVGQAVTEVYAYDEANPAASDLNAADRAFELFNIGDDPTYGTPDPRAVDYRKRKNRSLSVGDVLAVDGRFYACDFAGWRELDGQPLIRQQHGPGTTPLY